MVLFITDREKFLLLSRVLVDNDLFKIQKKVAFFHQFVPEVHHMVDSAFSVTEIGLHNSDFLLVHKIFLVPDNHFVTFC
jgi:hypothetical protein